MWLKLVLFAADVINHVRTSFAGGCAYFVCVGVRPYFVWVFVLAAFWDGGEGKYSRVPCPRHGPRGELILMEV